MEEVGIRTLRARMGGGGPDNDPADTSFSRPNASDSITEALETPSPSSKGVEPFGRVDTFNDDTDPKARWTKIHRRLVNLEALEAGKEMYEVFEDAVVVFRILKSEEIQAYMTPTREIKGAFSVYFIS